MGHIDKNFGKSGDYIHNYLSFWRQFGIIPFISLVLILFFCCFKIFKYWIYEKKVEGVPLFLFHFTLFALLEIIVARSFVSSYIWLGIAGISTYFNTRKDNI